MVSATSLELITSGLKALLCNSAKLFISLAKKN
uniref:Uncharacterized protein n=1 Tax=Ciona intestinalis TaxID=7719 RepID=H2Y2M7_CIOIN